jgi:hypothetical protein
LLVRFLSLRPSLASLPLMPLMLLHSSLALPLMVPPMLSLLLAGFL